MPKITYKSFNFREATLQAVATAEKIIEEYAQQGFSLTLRQLYYQFVARAFIPNTERSYKRLGGIVNDARLGGFIDWNAIEDRTRNLAGNQHWDSPQQIVRACVSGYRIEKWKEQEYTVEVWIEKEALAGVIERVCRELDVDYFACRGYVSQSEMWRAARRLQDSPTIVLHLGDHDPSGIDMTRDIQDRFNLFGSPVVVKRIALNMDQIEEFNPPPNPAKTTDSRFASYVEEFGEDSWELDALDPSKIEGLVREEVLFLRDEDAWDEACVREGEEKERLEEVSQKLEDGEL